MITGYDKLFVLIVKDDMAKIATHTEGKNDEWITD